jgi:alkaline phosphatase D
MHFTNSGTHAHLYFDSLKKRDALYQTLKKTAEKFVVYKPHEFPEAWHYNHPRAGDLLIAARPGYYIVDQDRDKFLATIKMGTTFGTHGYDPMLDKTMLGIFYAVGPNIVTGKTVPPFLNIHIYPLIARLLNLTTPPIDGDDRILRHIVR